jgi:drug/metabolite transporter (DMT)-like permease
MARILCGHIAIARCARSLTDTRPPTALKLSPRNLALLVIPPMAWAGNAVVGRMLVGAMPPVAMNAMRWALVALLLLPLAWRVLRQPRQLAGRWPYLLALGVLGIGSYNALQYLALQTSSPVNVTLIGASVPIWMMLVGWAGFGQCLVAWQWLGAALSLCGVLLVMGQGDLGVLWHLKVTPGDALMLLASLVWALYSWLLAHPPALMRGPHRPDWNWAEFLFVQALLGLLWATACSGLEALWLGDSAPQVWPGSRWQVWAGLGFIAVVPSILAYRCWALGVQAVGPTTAGLFINLIPVFAALWAALFLGQMPRWYHPVALLLIASGILVTARAQAPQR